VCHREIFEASGTVGIRVSGYELLTSSKAGEKVVVEPVNDLELGSQRSKIEALGARSKVRSGYTKGFASLAGPLVSSVNRGEWPPGVDLFTNASIFFIILNVG
jgi:hypothetical protein